MIAYQFEEEGYKHMVRTTTLGYPRIGRKRELKQACEAYWKRAITAEELLSTGTTLRKAHWEAQQAAGIELIPVNDFSFYDQVLDAISLLGAVPERFGWQGELVDLDTYFAMARGTQQANLDATALEMTKWFDTNYHYIVPEWHTGQRFRVASTKVFDEFLEAQAQGIKAKPVLIGPLTLALLGKAQDEHVNVLEEILPAIVDVYSEVITKLTHLGAEWIQLDEPCLVQDRTDEELVALQRVYTTLAQRKGTAKLIVATYFGHVGESFKTLTQLPVNGIALDFIRGPENLALLQQHGLTDDKILLAGVVDGRNIWRTNLTTSLYILEKISAVVPREQIVVTPSCSLLHVPYDLRLENNLKPELYPWLAFAEQKVTEVVVLARALHDGRDSVNSALQESSEAAHNRASSPLVHTASKENNPHLHPYTRLPYAERRKLQDEQLKLPLLPTTTIGSFPQTAEVRAMRRRLVSGQVTVETYERFVEQEIAETIRKQEELGLDVLVHGEFERNDMVQYFGEQLSGFAFTHHGWVQSYGSRCVRPPIIYGNVTRPQPMTVRWSAYAQSLTDKPVKGMLTGPVTVLNWSFVRDDQPRADTCYQIALTLRKEVHDLEQAGIRVIQVDEPALREGFPLRVRERDTYLTWAVESFRLTASGAGSTTQIHTHMCYSAFNDIIDVISALDADVISLENSRSGGELLKGLSEINYAKGIGPGVYDIHSPRIPSVDEIETIIRATLQVLPAHSVWVNPDCGLKTRTWNEVETALANMVNAAKGVRYTSPLGDNVSPA